MLTHVHIPHAQDRLIPYTDPPEGSRIDKALKAVGGALQAARYTRATFSI